MSVIYTLIARQQHVLCEYTEAGGNFPTVTRSVLRSLAQQQQDATTTSATRSVFPYQEHNFYFLSERGLTYLCMADAAVPSNVAFALLAEMQAKFVHQYGDQAQTAIAFAMTAFNAELHTLMKKYDNLKLDTPMAQVRQKMEKVKTLMIDNVNQLMERGEKLNLLVTRTEKLQQEAFKYEKASKKLKNTYWWKNVKYLVAIGVGLVVLGLWLSFMICGIDYSSCTSRVQKKTSDAAKHVGSSVGGFTTGVVDAGIARANKTANSAKARVTSMSAIVSSDHPSTTATNSNATSFAATFLQGKVAATP